MNAAGNVDYLPIWKKGSTAEEWLLELAMMARVHPDWFAKAVVVYESEITKNNTSRTRYQCRATTTTELLGLLELGKEEVHIQTRGARVS